MEGFLSGLAPFAPARLLGRIRRAPHVPAGGRAALCGLEDPRPQRPALREAVRGRDQPARHGGLRHQPVHGLDRLTRDGPAQARLRPTTHRRALAGAAPPTGRHRPHRLRRRGAGRHCRRERGSATGDNWFRRWRSWRRGSGTAAEPALRRVVKSAPAARPRGLRVGSAARPRPRAQGAPVSAPSRTPGVGAAHHGPRRADARPARPRRGSRIRRRGRQSCSGRATGPSAYQQTVRNVIGEWRLACRRHGIGYHRVTTDTPYGHVLREALAPEPGAR